jgi:hypothetical protein
MDFGTLFEHSPHPHIAQLASYCNELAGDSAMPNRNDFRPGRVSQLLGCVFLVEVIATENDYFFELCGSYMQIAFGADLSKKRLSTLRDEKLRTALQKTYDCVVQTGKPLYLRGLYQWPGKSVNIERLLVPMSDHFGNLTTILGAVVPDVDIDSLILYTGVGPAQLVPRRRDAASVAAP